MSELTHLDARGQAHMVDVSTKLSTQRSAQAAATVQMTEEAFQALTSGTAPKGDVLATVRIAAIQAAKRTSELIPLCHPLVLTHVALDVERDAVQPVVRLMATVSTTGQTGVEMEALTAVSVAALTLYDMLKAVDKAMVITTIKLLHKTGGKSGDWHAPEASGDAQR